MSFHFIWDDEYAVVFVSQPALLNNTDYNSAILSLAPECDVTAHSIASLIASSIMVSSERGSVFSAATLHQGLGLSQTAYCPAK